MTNLPFESDEYFRRIELVYRRMEAERLDVLIVFDPCSIVWLSGYDAWSFYLPQCLVVSPAIDRPFWVGRATDLPAARLTSWLGDTSLVGYGDDLVQQSGGHPVSLIVAEIRRRIGSALRAGVEYDSYYLTPRTFLALQQSLDRTELIDATSLIAQARSIKSEVELAVMRDAARIADHAMETALPMIEEGARECDVAAAVVAAQISGVDGMGGFYTSSPPFLLRGERGGSAHLTWGQGRFCRGDTVYLELLGCRYRYQACVSRAVQIGPVPDRVARAADASLEALDRGAEAARPGATCEEVAAAMMAVFDARGVPKKSRCGYGIGIAYPPTSGERSMSLHTGDCTEIETGMTFHLHPNLMYADWGIFITDTIIVTPSGGVPLSAVPRPLRVRS